MKNNSKRIFALLLAIVMCVSCVVPVFAEVDVHDHAEETPATVNCPGAGEEHTFTNCDSTFVKTVAPQCGKFGYDLYECNACKAPVVTNWTNPDNEDHVFGEPVVVKPATCYEKGQQVSTCTKCGVEVTADIEKIAHTLTNNKTEGVLCKDGIAAWTEWCTAEGCTYKVEHEAVEGKDCESRYVYEIVKAPNCKEDGLAIVKCRDCSYESSEVVVKATVGHNWVKDGEFTIAPTCGTAGSGNAKCTVCYAAAEVVKGFVTETFVVEGVDEPYVKMIEVAGFEATGVHDFSVDVAAKDATCTEDGCQAHKKCANCDATSLDGETEANVVINKLNHTWTDVPAVIATCTKNGNVAHSKCSVCGALAIDGEIVTADEVIAKAKHVYDLDGKPTAVRPATCTDFGFEFYACIVCGKMDTETGKENPDLPEDEAGFISLGVYRIPRTECKKELVSEVKGNCTTAAVKTYKCADCNKEYTEEVAAPGHAYVYTEVAATCAKPAYTKVTCENCNLNEVENEGTELDPDNHTIGTIYDSTPATCTQEGQNLGWCDDCGAFASEILPALGHKMDYETPVEIDDSNKEPGCGKDGVIIYTYKCTECDHTEKKNEKVADGIDHAYVPVVTDPTCLEAGYTTYTCSNCGDNYKADETPATGHNLVVDPALAVLPECILGQTEIKGGTKGHEVKKCTNANCDYTEDGAEIAFDWNNPAHHPGSAPNGEIYQEGNCTQPAYIGYDCPNCARPFYAIDDSMLGQHVIDKNIEGYGAYKAPTCEEAGEYEHGACSICNNFVYVDANGEFVIYDDAADYVIEALGHDWVDEAGKDATCTATGVKAYSYCTRLACMLHTLDRNAETIVPFDAADLKNVTLIPAKGHNFDTELVAEVPATCTDEGVKAHYECADCDAVSLDGVDACDADKLVIAAINHENGWINGESEIANCLEAGYDYKYCKFCGVEEVYNYVYPLGHTFVDVDEVSATCTAAGVAAHKECTVCGEMFAADEADEFSTNYKTEADLAIEMLPHKNANGDVITPECNSTVTDRTCASCGQTIAAQHNYVDNYVDATCQEYGYTASYCTICGDTVVTQNDNFKPKNPNHEDESKLVWVTTVEPGLYTEGEKQLVCEYCDYVAKTEVIPAIGGIEFTYEIDNAIYSGAEFVNGGQIKLTIKYEAVDVDLASIAIRLDYNANILTFVSGNFVCDAKDEAGRIFNIDSAAIGGMTPGFVVVTANTFAFGQTPVDKTLTGKGVFAEVYFNINKDVVAGSEFGFTVVEDADLSETKILNAAGEKVAANFGYGTDVAVTKALGDIDIDTKYTVDDELEFLALAATEDAYIAAADINQDGSIGAKDYQLLRDLLLGNKTYADMCDAAQK